MLYSIIENKYKVQLTKYNKIIYFEIIINNSSQYYFKLFAVEEL